MRIAQSRGRRSADYADYADREWVGVGIGVGPQRCKKTERPLDFGGETLRRIQEERRKTMKQGRFARQLKRGSPSSTQSRVPVEFRHISQKRQRSADLTTEARRELAQRRGTEDTEAVDVKDLSRRTSLAPHRKPHASSRSRYRYRSSESVSVSAIGIGIGVGIGIGIGVGLDIGHRTRIDRLRGRGRAREEARAESSHRLSTPPGATSSHHPCSRQSPHRTEPALEAASG